MRSLFKDKMKTYNSSWFKGRGIDDVKDFINKHKLVSYKYPDIKHELSPPDLKVILQLPCPTTAGFLNSKAIRMAKMFRNQLDIDESTVCQKCPKKEECKNAFIVSRQTPTLSEYLKFFHHFLLDPPKGENELTSAVVLIDKTTNLLKRITDGKYVIEKPLKVLGDIEGPIAAEKIEEAPKIKSKFIWKPKGDSAKKKEEDEIKLDESTRMKQIERIIRETMAEEKKGPPREQPKEQHTKSQSESRGRKFRR
ncbi:unnamed protein product [Blepharisma stoltei]|uniref:Uncharacterized protein n=1 Tax=Blepharisma stoltei TaxID=1481888 RepID=A0AAU9K6C2_9CILI|nr:unnamed protein product [Blepharisma stoltei]